MFQEFKEFIQRGSVLDLAVAVIIGAAFGAIVSSLVADIITPIIGAVMGGIDFSGQAIAVGEAMIGWGNFVQAIINFLMVAFVLFLVVRAANSMEQEKEEVPAGPPELSSEEKLLTEIRDLLKRQV